VVEAIVVAVGELRGEKRLVAYVVSKQAQSHLSEELRAFLRQKLPEYMVPALIIPLDALPLSSNGKIDRHALPDPDQTRHELASTFTAPRDALETQLVELWQEFLQVRPIGVTDNFFDIGGYSLAMVRMMVRVQQLCGKTVSLSEFFQKATIEQLAALLRETR
jgi:acyl carrier protein